MAKKKMPKAISAFKKGTKTTVVCYNQELEVVFASDPYWDGGDTIIADVEPVEIPGYEEILTQITWDIKIVGGWGAITNAWMGYTCIGLKRWNKSLGVDLFPYKPSPRNPGGCICDKPESGHTASCPRHYETDAEREKIDRGYLREQEQIKAEQEGLLNDKG